MRTKHLPLVSVTDRTPEDLVRRGWRPENRDLHNCWWRDPRTGEWWTIQQAASILADRRTPNYRFEHRRV